MTRIESDILERTGGDKRRLENFGYKVYSQSDEDGIIDEIFTRIGVTNRVFVEIGVETGKECNTLYLLHRGWSGLWIEGYPEYATAIQKSSASRLASSQLRLQGAYVNADNVNQLIADAGITGEIDLFSLDIDSNDFHVLKSLDVIKPRVLVLEHNHSFPPPARYIMPRNDLFRWSPGEADYGASLSSLTELAIDKGYTLVGCGLYSPNSFHVRSDLVMDRFSGPFTPEHFWNSLDLEKLMSYPRMTSEFYVPELDRLSSKCNQLRVRANALVDKVRKCRAKVEELQALSRKKRRPIRGWLGRVLYRD